MIVETPFLKKESGVLCVEEDIMKKTIPLIIALLLFTSFPFALAELKTFVKEYTYQASEADSKISSRTIALEQVKRLLLEELGTYIESHTEVTNFQLTKDQITTLTAGIVQTQILKEKWDGERYWMQAKIEADPDEVSKSIDQLRKNHEKMKDNQKKIKSKDELLNKIEILKKEISVVKGVRKNQLKKEYNKTINKVRALEWMEKGNYFIGTDEKNKALDAFNKAIQLDTQNPDAYLCRATYYMNLVNYKLALEDCETAIRFNPTGDVSPGPYMLKGLIYSYMKQFNKALNELERAIAINPKNNQIYVFRGDVYSNLGNYKQALVDYEKAIELDNEDALSYEGRGIVPCF